MMPNTWTIALRGARSGLIRSCAVLGFAVFTVAADLAEVQTEALPKGEEILDRYVKATGGPEAYERLKNRITTARVEVRNTSIRGSMTTEIAAPNKLRMVLDYEARGRNERGFDGETAWELTSRSGARIVEGEERASAIRNATFNAELRWRELFEKVETVGVESVNGRPCYKVHVTRRGEKPQTQYFDQQSGLRTKTTMPFDSPQGEVVLEIAYEDYREVDGIRLPFVTRNITGVQEQTMIVERVEHNVNLPADHFDLPKEVKALIYTRKGALDARNAEPSPAPNQQNPSPE